MAAVPLQRLLIAFWALYLSVVTLTNTLDALIALGVLGSGWTFASGNYAAVVEVMSRYPLPGLIHAAAFAGVIAWEAVGAVLLWRATVASRGLARPPARPLYLAFGALVGLWCAFMVVDELFMAYQFESTHRELLIASLASLLVIVLLPQREPGLGRGRRRHRALQDPEGQQPEDDDHDEQRQVGVDGVDLADDEDRLGR